MQPGQQVFTAIVNHFGPQVLTPSGSLDRGALARLSFEQGRVAELNAIVHPAVITRQAELAAEIAARLPNAVLLVESALLFETEHAGPEGWRARFDRVLLVTAGQEDKIRRFVDRTALTSNADKRALETDARRRLGHQINDANKSRWADFVIRNEGSMDGLKRQVEDLWPQLRSEACASRDASAAP